MRRSVRRVVVLRQALPLFLAAGDRHAAEIVVGAPRLALLWHRGEYQIVPVRTEGKVIADREGTRRRIRIAVAGRDVLRLSPLAVVPRNDEQVLALVLDVGVPVAVEQP